MKAEDIQLIENAKKAAEEVLLHNAHGPFSGLPRTAGWGYPEPYTRDLLLSIFGIAILENKALLESIKNVLEILAKNQTSRGLIPSLVHNNNDRDSSDTTPLFLLAVGIYRNISKDADFLKKAVQKSLIWMEYQSPSDRCMVAQQPTSDWRDEQMVMGYGLFVNTLVYSYLRLMGKTQRAHNLLQQIKHSTITSGTIHKHGQEGLLIKGKSYFAFWSYKIYSSERFDLLGNSFAILSGLASPSRANSIIA